MLRGCLSNKVQEVAKKFMHKEITIKELRLIPYIQYVMVNDQKIDPQHIDLRERDIFQQWREAGYIEGGASGLSITKEFWDFMCEILFIAYVDYDG